MFTTLDRVKLLIVGAGLFLCAYKSDPTAGPILVALGYLLVVVLMATTPRD